VFLGVCGKNNLRSTLEGDDGGITLPHTLQVIAQVASMHVHSVFLLFVQFYNSKFLFSKPPRREQFSPTKI